MIRLNPSYNKLLLRGAFKKIDNIERLGIWTGGNDRVGDTQSPGDKIIRSTLSEIAEVDGNYHIYVVISSQEKVIINNIQSIKVSTIPSQY